MLTPEQKKNLIKNEASTLEEDDWSDISDEDKIEYKFADREEKSTLRKIKEPAYN